MTGLHPDLLSTLGSAEILAPTRYRVLGQVRDIPPQGRSAGMAGRPSANNSGPDTSSLLAVFGTDLYSQLYVRPSATGPGLIDPLAQRDLVHALSAANSGRGGWEPGWVVDRVMEDGRVAVAKDGLTFWTVRDEVQARPGRLRPELPCRVRVGKELRHLLPGYYMAIGDGDSRLPRARARPLIRLYWHLTPEAAVPFMSTVTKHLNGAGVPFRAKVLNTPHAYHRADAGVLYLERPWYRRSTALLTRMYRELERDLRREVPLFTRPLAAGLGMAEDPANGMSFGQHRCHLVALASWTSFTRGESTLEARAATLARSITAAHLDPSRFHLGPRARDSHALQAAIAGTHSFPE